MPASEVPGMFSVLMPTVGRPSVVAAVESVQAQTDQNFEILLVADGSSDETFECLEELASRDERIRLYRRPTNSGGPAAARNVGLTEARGEFIALLDDDDTWFPEKIEVQRAKFEEADYALVYAEAVVRSPHQAEMDGRLWSEAFPCSPAEGAVTSELIACNFVPALTAVVRRKWAEIAGGFGDPQIHGSVDDYHYWLRIALEGGRFGRVRLPLAVYTWSASGIAHSLAVTPVRDRRLADVYRNLARRYPRYRAVLRARERQLRLRRARQSFAWLPGPAAAAAARATLAPRLWFP
jgi:glycosyltransferase involved in cell wall biosynthesis